MDNRKYVQAGTFTLYGSGATAGATTVQLSSFYQLDGVTTLTMTDFGTKGFIVLEPNNGSQEETFSFTGITQNADLTATLTGVKTVLFVDPYTETSGLAKSHPGGAKAIISNPSAFYAEFANKNNDETIAGQYTFSNTAIPELDADHTYTSGDELKFITYAQLQSTSYAGTVNASTTAKGIVQLATQSQVDNKSTTGSSLALLVVTPDKLAATKYIDYVADSGTVNAHAVTANPIVTLYTAGLVAYFKSATTNTSTTPSLSLNGLTAKTIKKQSNNSTGQPMVAGDIITNSLVGVIYDGTAFNMIAPVARTVNTTSAGALPALSAINLTSMPITGLYDASQAPGDIIYQNTTGGWSRVAVGTVNQVLTSNAGGTAVEWVNQKYTILGRLTTSVNNSDDTNANTLYSVVIPGGTIGANGSIRVTVVAAGAGGSITTLIDVKLGASVIGTLASLGTDAHGQIRTDFWNQNNQNNNQAAYVGIDTTTIENAAILDTSENTTSDATLSVVFTQSSSGDTVSSLRYVLVELLN